MVNSESTTRIQAGSKFRPMPIWESLLYFLVITLLMIFCFYVVRPFLQFSGLNEYGAYLVSLSIVGIVMLVWTFTALFLEKNLLSWEIILKRLRLKRITPGLLGWSIGLGLLMFSSTIFFSPVITRLINTGIMPLPDQIPNYINPLRQLSILQIKEEMTSQGVLYFIPIVLIINIFGEEFFWRGYVFPRQELRNGKITFLIHGLIWGFTHLFQYWLILPILVGSIALSFLVQRTKNTWIGILAHMLNNGLPFIIMAISSA